MSGAIPLLPYTPLWRAQEELINFLFSLVLHDRKTHTVFVLVLTTSGECYKFGKVPGTSCLPYLNIELRFLQLEVVFLAPRLSRLLHIRYTVYFDQILVNQLVQILFGSNTYTQCFP
jgi:hypothetical protein